jgi:hypothetical protein
MTIKDAISGDSEALPALQPDLSNLIKLPQNSVLIRREVEERRDRLRKVSENTTAVEDSIIKL